MAGVDQGAASIFTLTQTGSLVRVYLTGLLFEKGFGVPVQMPSTDGLFQPLILSVDDLTGPRTNVDRPSIPGGGDPPGEAGVATVANSDQIGGMIDWWDDVHVLPRTEIAFGNIITQKEDTYEIYSAYRSQSITLDSIVNNALPGIALPDEGVPEVVPPQSSMLDATTTDNLGDSFVLGTMVLRSIIAETNGLSVFDTTVDFTFDTGDTVQLFISGLRIVLMSMEYETPVKETLAFLTEVITGLTGKEQRIALRKNPRQLFDVVYKLTGNDRQRMQALLMDWTNNVFGFPLWHEKLTLTAAASTATTVYSVVGADDIDLRVGGLAIVFTDANVFDVITIASLTDTTITATDPSVNSYPVGTTIMPLRTAVIRKMVSGAREIVNLETFKILFEVNDNDTGALSGDVSAFSTFGGKVLFDDCNVMSGQMGEEYKRRIYRIDNQTGVVAISATWDRNKRVHQKGFSLRNRLETLNFRKAMIAIGGRVKSFYIPTFSDDLTVAVDLSTGANTMDIERIEYERFVQSREPKVTFKITFTDGTSLVRVVQSATGVDATTERLTLDTTWPANRTVAEIVRVQFYEQSRFAADNVVINHQRIGLASSQMPVLQVFDGN